MLELVQNGILKIFKEIRIEAKPNTASLAQLLLQVSILRLIVRLNAKCGVDLIKDFLFAP